MPAPTTATYSAAAISAATTAFRNLIDAGSGPGLIRVRSAADALLAEIVLTDPCGTISGTTGQLTLTPAGPDASADAGGTAAYAQICDSAGTVHLSLPAEAGVSPVSGRIVFNTLTIVAGQPVEIISATIG